MLGFFWLIFAVSVNAGPCKPDEMYVRGQTINSYTKSDGTDVSTHFRKAHCRAISRYNHFQDETTQDFKRIKPILKPWKANDKKIVETELTRLPKWLAKYPFKEILRADQGGHPLNPAATIPGTRTLLIFDQFFKEKNQRAIIIHEASHLAIYDFTEREVKLFAKTSGWLLRDRSSRTPPNKLLERDSQNSISEDFANHVEHYYVNPKKLMIHNSLSFLLIKQFIDLKESQK